MREQARSKIYAILKPHIPIQEIKKVVDEVMEVMPEVDGVKALKLNMLPRSGKSYAQFQNLLLDIKQGKKSVILGDGYVVSSIDAWNTRKVKE